MVMGDECLISVFSMSYDLYGIWDKINKWVGLYFNVYINLIEIKEVMNFFWRNDINLNKVVFGIGFYGCVFIVISLNCFFFGCIYEFGVFCQFCSNEISVMIQFEIVDVMKRIGCMLILDKEVVVKILIFDSN